MDGWPDQNNTGPAAGGYTDLVDWEGDARFNTDNELVEGYRFNDALPQIFANNVTFRGCVINSSTQQFATRLDGNNTVFEYCEFKPTFLDLPPETGWVAYEDSYVQAIKMFAGKGCRASYCNIWGHANGFEFQSDSADEDHPLIMEHCWIHDQAAIDRGDVYHHDGFGPGDPTGPITLHHNRITSKGNTNGIALQNLDPEGPLFYHDITITDNWLSGYGYTVNLGANGPVHNVIFTGNVYSTELDPDWGPMYNVVNWPTYTGTKVWANNRWRVPEGAEYGNPAWDGNYWWPSDGYSNGGHATDYAG